MHSAMNIEFVYLILIGINTFMEELGNKGSLSHDEILDSRNFKGGRNPEMSKISM
jgi:hypothetical protein